MTGDMGELFNEYKKERQNKRWNNYEQSLKNLEKWGIPYQVLNEATAHVLVCNDIDFWPTTGKWRRRTFGHSGRGVQKLKHYVQARIKEESA